VTFKLTTAFSKFLFCIRISASVNTFVKLLYNTKRFKWYKKSNASTEDFGPGAAYQFKINGKLLTVYLRTFQGDMDIFYEIFWRKIYKMPLQLQQNKVIVDIGANIGMAALYFVIHYPSAQIICIEPDKYNYIQLQKNCFPYANIKIMQAAIMPEDCFVSIKRALLQYNNSVGFSENEKDNVQAISMKTLFSIFQLTMVDIMKMDIEGAEEAIFSADTTWLDNIKQLLIEIHNPKKDNACFIGLQKYKFKIISLNPNAFSESVYLAVNNHKTGNI
jgi:FkbM family methyltransferase